MPNVKQGLLALTLLAGCATTAPQHAAAPPPPTTLAAVGEVRPGLGFANGYLPLPALPNSLTLVPPPPAPGSAAMAADQAAYELALTASPERFALATSDADLNWPHPAESFEAIIGFKVTTDATPNTAMLLRRVLTDAGLSTYRAKDFYKRTRPFVVNNSTTCTPAEEPMLRKDGSYPSGHTAIGWILAMTLTDLVPDKTDALMKRGYDFGESRIICRVHWYSDTVAGRNMAAATYARLQADPVFQAQRELARAEIAKVRKP